MYRYNKPTKELIRVNESSGDGVIINAISDLHIEFFAMNTSKDIENVERVVEAYIYLMLENTKVKGDILLIGGDISNYNIYSKEFLRQVSKHWNVVCIIDGNHEYYLQGEGNRYERLYEDTTDINNLIFLGVDYPTIEYYGINIAGNMMMYDISNPDALNDFLAVSNDSEYMSIDFVKKKHIEGLEYFEEYGNADIFMSHIPLIYVENKYFKYSKLYHNSSVNPSMGTLYLHGHTHQNGVIDKYGVTAINISNGYLGDAPNQPVVTTIEYVKGL